MKICLITGSAGLVGSESVEFFSEKFDLVVGIDNNMRQQFFGEDASTAWNVERLTETIPNYKHYNIDIRSEKAVDAIFREYKEDLKLIVHTAAQPSHDWAAQNPITDFTVNANGTLVLLEMTRRHCPEAVFIFCSTNKVYGDTPNRLPFVELETRWEIDKSHPYFGSGIDENMSIDQSTHSLFGVSKVGADLLVQEYGRYFNMKTVCFRGGCLTGPNHSGTELHGFLAYLVRCAITGKPYTIFGYKGKQVRDNIHSYDLINMFWHFYQNPQSGAVYNAGGSRHSNGSILEAINMCDEITGNKMKYVYSEKHRMGDHRWWISDINKFKREYPEWDFKFNIRGILTQIFDAVVKRV